MSNFLIYGSVGVGKSKFIYAYIKAYINAILLNESEKTKKSLMFNLTPYLNIKITQYKNSSAWRYVSCIYSIPSILSRLFIAFIVRYLEFYASSVVHAAPVKKILIAQIFIIQKSKQTSLKIKENNIGGAPNLFSYLNRCKLFLKVRNYEPPKPKYFSKT